MHHTKTATMITLFACMSQGKNHYTVAAPNTLRKLLKIHYIIEIGRRWFFQSMKDITDDGYIKRDTRYRQDHNGIISQIPSMVIFKLRGIVQLVKMNVKGAKEVYKSMVTYLKKDDGRFPSRTDFDDGSYSPPDPDERKKLEGLLGIVTKKIS
jgi:hypothetical protein